MIARAANKPLERMAGVNRRRLVLTAPSAAALSTSVALGQGVTVEATRTSVPQYVGALTIMRRQADWVLQEVTALLDAQERDDEEWRIDVLAPFAVVEAMRQSGRTIVPPGKYANAHANWLDVVDALGAAGLHLRTGVLDDNERSFDLATGAMDRAQNRLDEVDAVVPRRVGRTI
jgi:hypothetical protein